MSSSATKPKGSSIWFNFYRTREHLLTEHVSHKVFATYYVEALPDAMGFTGDLFFFEGNNITYGQNFICFSNYVHRTSRRICFLLLFWSSSGVSHFGVQFFFAPISTRTCCPRNNQTSAELVYANRKGYAHLNAMQCTATIHVAKTEMERNSRFHMCWSSFLAFIYAQEDRAFSVDLCSLQLFGSFWSC